ncbi:MAG: hypothetical protein K2F90_01085, partial [Clostridiales bacterium]|nr:hypothetical protein [Clostridiales bacterium]
IANVVTGICAIVASNKKAKILKWIPIVAMVADAVVIPANAIALACGAYLLYTEVNWLSVLIFIVAVCAITLAIAGLALGVIRITKRDFNRK